MNKHEESIALGAEADAAVQKGAGVAEQLSLSGHYTCVCTGPVEKYRDEFNELNRLLAEAEDLGNVQMARDLLDRIAGIPIEEKWADLIENVVTTVGANLALDTFLAGSSYTAVTYLGLISNVSYTTGPAVGDTMASHGGWTEAGGTNAPAYSGGRKAPTWTAASAKSKTNSGSPASFTFTSGSGVIVKGCFLVYGSGASSTVDNTGGTLYSAGLFSGGDKTVSSGDTLSVTYTANA